MSKIEETLRMQIKQQLENVSEANSPNIFWEIHLPSGSINVTGYARVEAKIIDRVISGKIHPAAVIPQLEMEYELM